MTELAPGLRIKCIDGTRWGENGVPDTGPSTNSVWTVKEVHRNGTLLWNRLTGFDYLKLHGWPDNQVFRADMFRPLNGSEDISALKAMLNKGPVKGERITHVHKNGTSRVART